MSRWAHFVHTMRGTRSLSTAVALLTVLTLLEPILGQGWAWSLGTLPAMFLVVLGVATLPREGVTVQDRVYEAAASPEGARLLLRRALLPAVLVVLLLPRLFLVFFGIPHLTPWTGLLAPSVERSLALGYLFLILWLPLVAIRRTHVLAPHLEVFAPSALASDDPRHRRRTALLLLIVAVVAVWVIALRPFWHPFSLFSWPPGLGSLTTVAGPARIAYVIILPTALLTRLAAHAGALLRTLRLRPVHVVATAGALTLHVVLTLAAAALALYDLFWIVQYQNTVQF